MCICVYLRQHKWPSDPYVVDFKSLTYLSRKKAGLAQPYSRPASSQRNVSNELRKGDIKQAVVSCAECSPVTWCLFSTYRSAVDLQQAVPWLRVLRWKRRKERQARISEGKVTLCSVKLPITLRLHVCKARFLRRPFCPSVCLSVKSVHCDKTKKLVPTFLYRMNDRSS